MMFQRLACGADWLIVVLGSCDPKNSEERSEARRKEVDHSKCAREHH
jgi:hypothetical protein